MNEVHNFHMRLLDSIGSDGCKVNVSEPNDAEAIMRLMARIEELEALLQKFSKAKRLWCPESENLVYTAERAGEARCLCDLANDLESTLKGEL